MIHMKMKYEEDFEVKAYQYTSLQSDSGTGYDGWCYVPLSPVGSSVPFVSFVALPVLDVSLFSGVTCLQGLELPLFNLCLADHQASFSFGSWVVFMLLSPFKFPYLY